MNNHIPSIHELLNARSSTVSELCDNFILNEHFSKLASSNHTIMIGPRGSGKTTLMRMLEVESLELWNHEESYFFRNNIKFSGVFIPTDRLWKTQYDNAKSKVVRSPNDLAILEASFIYHVLEKIVSVVSFRTSRIESRKNNFRSVNLNKRDEADLVRELASLWYVKPKIPSLRSLEVAVTVKKQLVSNYISGLIIGRTKESNSRPEIIDGGIVLSISSSIRVINTYFNERGAKWAFLFDELELAPEDIVQPLLDAMRGGPEDIIFKLALSPYHKNVSVTDSPESSMKDQDHVFINLTGSSEREGLRFSKNLCENIFRKNGLNENIESYFEGPVKMKVEQEFLELSDKDNSFKSYLDQRGIEVGKFDTYKEKDKLPIIRKIQFVVLLRNYYKDKDGKNKSRRRPPDYYGGFPNICRAMEHNPRMLIGIMNMFIHSAKESGSIPIHLQLKNLNNFFESYRALLSTIAVDSTYRNYNTIYDLIEKIAKSFRKQILGDRFQAEPKGSLIFKKSSNEHLSDAIGLALNSGALIVDKDDASSFHDIVDIKNTRCRLSYLFSHHFGLLMTNPREIDLIDLLEDFNIVNESINVVQPSLNHSRQMDLL